MKKYGLVGFPLGHSFSAGYFAEKFSAQGLAEEYSYENFPVERIEDLRSVLPTEVCGFNITIPHKRNILPLLSEIDPEAGEVGAVNCVRVLPDGAFRGYNTDVYGFEMSLRKMLGGQLAIRALVLGTGGAAQAVHYVLRKLGIGFLDVSRTASGPERIEYGQLTREILAEHRLIVNTTPLGMFPNVADKPALPYEFIGCGHYLYDLIYNPAETSFLREGRRRGAWVKSGLEMLVLQAERSWEIWNG